MLGILTRTTAIWRKLQKKNNQMNETGENEGKGRQPFDINFHREHTINKTSCDSPEIVIINITMSVPRETCHSELWCWPLESLETGLFSWLLLSLASVWSREELMCLNTAKMLVYVTRTEVVDAVHGKPCYGWMCHTSSAHSITHLVGQQFDILATQNMISDWQMKPRDFCKCSFSYRHKIIMFLAQNLRDLKHFSPYCT